MLEVCDQSRSLGRSDGALPPSYLRLCAFHQGGADIYCGGKQRTFICFISRGVSSILSLRDLEIKGTFEAAQIENMEEKKNGGFQKRRMREKKLLFKNGDTLETLPP